MLIISRIKSIYSYRGALWASALSQFKAKYVGSLLGIFWAALNPLLMMLAVTFVFSIIFKVNIDNFALFALAGIVPWTFFASTVSEMTISLKANKNILRQFNLPKEIIPLSIALANLFNFLVGWLIIYPIFLFFKPTIFFLFPYLIGLILMHFLFICGFGLVLSILHIFLRDVEHLLGVILMLWFWITPIFYSVDMTPLNFRWICEYNPMSFFIMSYRDIVFTGSFPAIITVIVTIFLSLTAMILGLAIFARFESEILKKI